MNILIVDALAANEGRRKFSRDAIGIGPRLLAGICSTHDMFSRIIRAEDILEDETVLSIEDFDIFLISGMSVDKIAVERVIKKIRNSVSSANIILGGPIASNTLVFTDIQVNAAVFGEGEWVLNDLIIGDFSIDSLSSEKYQINKINQTDYVRKIQRSTSNIFETFSPSINHIKDYNDFWYSKVYVEAVRGCSNHYRGELTKQEGGCSDCENCGDLDTIVTDNCPEDIPPGCGFCSVPSTFGAPINRPVKLIVNEV
ncbi:MAG: hypothetical protein ACXABK_02665, partial [Candidatus Heimdallarchaeaceae archaeon]